MKVEEPINWMPSVAVVVPMHNAVPWLPQLLAALVKEWDVSFELIAVDDSSSDGSANMVRSLCNHWPAHRWRLLKAGGRGVSAARNQAVAATQAPVIAFLDADDRPLQGRLASPLQALQDHPELAHVHGGWWRTDASGALQHPVRPWREGADFGWREVIEHKAVLPSAWTIRRQAFLDVGGFDSRISHSEDVDLLVRLAAAGYRGAWVSDLLVRYRVHPGSASGRLKAQLDGLLDVLERHLKDAPEQMKGWACQQRYDTTTWSCWQAWSAGQPDFALQLLGKALRRCPYPLPRRPVHLLEVFHRSCARVGESFDRASFQLTPFWRTAQEMLLCPIEAFDDRGL